MSLDFLFGIFEQNSDKIAMIYANKHYYYSDLLSNIYKLTDDFKSNGLLSGQVVSIESQNPTIALSSFLSLIRMNCIVVPFTPDTVVKKEEYASISGVEIYVEEINDKLEYTKTGFSISNEYYDYLRRKEHPGLILFSSGTTGKSKAAVHDLSKLLQKYKTKRKDLSTLAFMQFDHIGGVDTIFYTLSNGSTLVFPEDRSPDTICENIEKHKVEVLPATPTFLNLLLLSEAYRRYDLSSLRYITYGTEPMPESTLIKLNELFPEIQFLQKYGTTEVGTLRSKSKNKTSNWVKIGGEGYQTRIVDGMLEIKADSAMLGYLNAPSPFTEDGWFKTGDEVEVKGDYYRILGRRSEVINVGGEKVFPMEIEDVIQDIPYVSEAIVYGEKNMIMGNIVVADISLTKTDIDKNELIKEIKDHCKEKLQSYKVPVKIYIIDDKLHSQRFKKVRKFS